MHDSPPLALPAHCTPGDDGRHRERHHRDQEPRPPRRVLKRAAAGAWHGRRQVGGSFLGDAVAFEDCFSMASVVWFPLQAVVVAAHFLDFDGSSFSTCRGGAGRPLCSWHGVETTHMWLLRAETGLIGQSPTGTVGTNRFHEHRRRQRGSSSPRLVGAWQVQGGEKLGMRVVRSYGRK